MVSHPSQSIVLPATPFTCNLIISPDIFILATHDLRPDGGVAPAVKVNTDKILPTVSNVPEILLAL